MRGEGIGDSKFLDSTFWRKIVALTEIITTMERFRIRNEKHI